MYTTKPITEFQTVNVVGRFSIKAAYADANSTLLMKDNKPVGILLADINQPDQWPPEAMAAIKNADDNAKKINALIQALSAIPEGSKVDPQIILLFLQ
jgi:hypothetical protein